MKRFARSLKKSLKAGRARLLDKDEWTYETMREEIDREHGMTYLKHFARKFKADISRP